MSRDVDATVRVGDCCEFMCGRIVMDKRAGVEGRIRACTRLANAALEDGRSRFRASGYGYGRFQGSEQMSRAQLTNSMIDTKSMDSCKK